MTEEKTEELEQIPCIRYFMIFKDQTETLLDTKCKSNVMNQAFPHQLGLKIQKINIEVQQNLGSTLGTYEMAVSIFSKLDNNGKRKSFEQSFLLADVESDVVFKISFLIMSNVDNDYPVQN